MFDASPESNLTCPNCAHDMLLIGRLPIVQLRRLVLVYRCERCNRVVAQEDASASFFPASAPRDSTRHGP